MVPFKLPPIGSTTMNTGKSGVHTFHIPVMGTGFTIDTPLRVAKYGISSVISLVDDILIEQMRKYHSRKNGIPYEQITDADSDPRARRITAYLDLLGTLVGKQIEEVRKSSFEPDSEITRYFEQLPASPLKNKYLDICTVEDPVKKRRMQDALRSRVVAGDIDVNVMTKLDRERFIDGHKCAPEMSDARAALRGFANSSLNSSIVCSAGMNRGFYRYFSSFDDFYPDADGVLKKRIVLKVSDIRSAEIQGKFLAKRGLWVSEFRIESGLNCGGHAFPAKGYLMGPIMEEFMSRRFELAAELHEMYSAALKNLGRRPTMPKAIRVTVQGGVGTSREHEMLLGYYRADSVGWGTPFLLVPEAVNVDKEHIDKLIAAEDRDIYLSESSPLGVPFWNLRTSASEEMRRKRISDGRPGSPCHKGILRLDTEMGDIPLCVASREYQRKKLAKLETESLPDDRYEAKKEAILVKSCICHDLAGGVTKPAGIDPEALTAVCPGPNIVNFKLIFSLREMIDHIYGRRSVMNNPDRPNLFVSELSLYIDYLRNEVEKSTCDISSRTEAYLADFKDNLIAGIDYYLSSAEKFIEDSTARFVQDVIALREELERIPIAVPT